MAKFFVCQSTNCKRLESEKLLRDLEELCAVAPGCQAVSSGCLDLCGRGPNVKILTTGDQKVVEGVKTWKAARSLLEKNGAKLRKLDFQVAEVKYEARRTKTSEDRLSKVQQGFKAIGGEASSKEPELSSSLFTLRAEERLNQDPSSALTDARKAAELAPSLAAPRWTAAMAMLKLGQVEQAREEAGRAQDAAGSFNKEHMREVMKQLAENPPPKAEVAEAPKAEAKAEAPKVEAPQAKAKASQETKVEAKAPAKAPKAKAKVKADETKPEEKAKSAPTKGSEKKLTRSSSSLEKSDEKKPEEKAKSAPTRASDQKLTKLTKSSSSLEKSENPKKLKNGASTTSNGSKTKNSTPEIHPPEDTQTTAAEVLSVSAASAPQSPCVAHELSETGLVDPAPSAVLPGWRSPMLSPKRKIVSL